MKQPYLYLILIIILFNQCNPPAIVSPSASVRKKTSANLVNDCTPFSQRIIVKSSAVTKDSAWLQLPCDYNTLTGSLRKYPLLIFFNGTGETSNKGNLDTMKILGPPKYINDSIRYEFTNGGVPYDMIVLCPQSKTGYRSAVSTNNVINYAIQNFRIDTTRIYLTGLSSGAQSVFYYLTEKEEYAKRIAAAVPMSSLKLDDIHKKNLKFIARAKVAIQSFCGVYDYLYSYNNSYVNRINKYRPNLASLTDYKGSHCCWNGPYSPTHSPYNPNIYEWMLQYHK